MGNLEELEIKGTKVSLSSSGPSFRALSPLCLKITKLDSTFRENRWEEILKKAFLKIKYSLIDSSFRVSKS